VKTEFYKMEYEAWDEGTDNLTLEQEGAYLRLCHQMYRRRGPIPNQMSTLARIWRCHSNKAAALLRQLIDAGKIKVTPEGGLTQTRVTHELQLREIMSTTKAHAGHIGGTQRAQNVAKSLKILDGDQADASSNSKQVQAIREDKSREDKKDSRSVANATRPADRFDELWTAYPKREGSNEKKPARIKYEKMIRDGVDHDKLVAAVKHYADQEAKNIGTRFIKRTITWLNEWSPDDEAETIKAPAVTSIKFFAEITSAAWCAWDKHSRATTGRPAPQADFRPHGELKRGWYFDSQFPPSAAVEAIDA
jgi:uncharacterized protein YdaU (DUF1376 family)